MVNWSHLDFVDQLVLKDLGHEAVDALNDGLLAEKNQIGLV